MATAHMPDEFFDAVAHRLPPEQTVCPQGGRPRIDHRTALRVIWFVPEAIEVAGQDATVGEGR